MIPGKDNFIIYQWSTFSRQYTFKLSDGATPPVLTPIDLTGYTITAQLRKNDVLLVAFTVTVDPDPTTGKITLSLTDEQTGVLPPNTFYDCKYDIKFAPLNGVDYRAVEGDVMVSAGQTR
jgi:hypothetical protein